MGKIKDLAYAGTSGAWRNYNTLDVPASLVHPPAKNEIATLFDAIDRSRAVIVTDYGASGDGVSDETTALANAATAARAAGKAMIIPNGIFLTSAAIDYSGIDVLGFGGGTSILKGTGSTHHILSKNSATPSIVARLGIRSTVTKSAGAGVAIDGNAQGDQVLECDIRDQFDGVAVTAGIAERIIGNNITNAVHSSISIQNTVNSDSGDWVAASNICNTSIGGTTVAILVQSGGGGRVYDNKVLGHSYACLLQPGTTVNTGMLQLSLNNFDTQTIACIALSRPSGSGLWKNVHIIGNILVGPTGIISSGAADWLSLVTITSNNITYTTNAMNLNAGSGYRIANNQCEAATADATGIIFGASFPLTTEVGRNTFRNTVNFYNLNGNTGVVVDDDKYFKAVVPVTVSALPTASAALKGRRMYVTDANSTTFNATAVGGGSNNVPVNCNGTNWVIG